MKLNQLVRGKLLFDSGGNDSKSEIETANQQEEAGDKEQVGMSWESGVDGFQDDGEEEAKHNNAYPEDELQAT